MAADIDGWEEGSHWQGMSDIDEKQKLTTTLRI